MYKYVWLGHSAVQQKLTEHCKSTITKLKKKNNNNRNTARHQSFSQGALVSLWMHLSEDVGSIPGPTQWVEDLALL